MRSGETMTDIKLHHSFDDIHENEWNELLHKSGTDAPFLQYGYLKRWWEHKGGGEWTDAELALISGWENGELIGIAPLFVTIQDGKRKLFFLGSIEISDYLDFIFDPNYAEDFFTNLFDFLSKDDFSVIHNLLLYNLPESSITNTYLEKECEKRSWKIQMERAYHTPAIPLADDWDVYLTGIDKKQRHEIRRKLRRAEESPETIRWYQVTERDSLNAEMDELFRLMTLDPDKKNFLTGPMREQMRSIMHWAFDENILQLSFLTIEGKKAAAYLCFDYQEHIWVYNSGFDPEFKDYSPGWIMLSYLIQHAIHSGKKVFDFMRGDEDYKYRFGAKDHFVLKIEIIK